MISVVKQYGEQRTGTNYLRALIHRNFPQVLVLSYILGDKHSAPVDFKSHWRQSTGDGTDAAANFVRAATYSRPGAASQAGDRTQQQQINRLAPRIAQAYADNQLGFLISIKDPYAWIVSIARFQLWIHNDHWPTGTLDQVRQACLQYNHRYKAWMELIRQQKRNAKLIRYESLLAQPADVASDIARRFGWEQIHGFTNTMTVVNPTIWDHLPVSDSPVPFQAEYYLNRDYLQQLPGEHRRMIDETMDWSLLSELDYFPA